MRKHVGVISYITFLVLSLAWLIFYWGDIGAVQVQQKLFFSSRAWLIPLLISGFILAYVLLPAVMWYGRNESPTMTSQNVKDAGLAYPIFGLIVLVCTIGEPAQTFFYALGLEYLQMLSTLLWVATLGTVATGIAFTTGMFKPKAKAPQNVPDS